MTEANRSMQEVLLAVISEHAERGGSLDSNSVLKDAARQLKSLGVLESDQALLTLWHDQFRNGRLAWGYNLQNNGPPFFHLTAAGRRTLEDHSRDPANPDGYLAHLCARTTINPIAESYICEALQTYNSGCFKATAVLVGCAAESLALELRDRLVSRLRELGLDVPNMLNDWRIRTVLRGVKAQLDQRSAAMDRGLRERYEGYWMAFAQQIRAVRNDSGHPASVAPVTPESVHAALLIFPELATLSGDLATWIDTITT